MAKLKQMDTNRIKLVTILTTQVREEKGINKRKEKSSQASMLIRTKSTN